MGTATFSQLHSAGFTTERCPVSRTVMPNSTRSYDGFHISYCRGETDYGCDTTALVVRGHVFLVLNGCHVCELAQAADESGLEGCVSLFIDLIAHANPYSEHLSAVGLAADPFGVAALFQAAVSPATVTRLRACARQSNSGS